MFEIQLQWKSRKIKVLKLKNKITWRKKDEDWPKEEQRKWRERRERGSQTHWYHRFLLLLFRVALAFGQPAFHVVRQAFVAVLTHWLQIYLHKLIPDRAGRKERGQEVQQMGKRIGKADDGERHWGWMSSGNIQKDEKRKTKGRRRRDFNRETVREERKRKRRIQEDKCWEQKGGVVERQVHRDKRLKEKGEKIRNKQDWKIDS